MPRIADVERAHALALKLDAQRRVRASLADLDVERGALYARQLRVLGDMARLSAERAAHAVLDVAGTLGVGQAKAVRLLDHGRRAAELYPRALELLECGALRPATVELLLHVTAKCSDEVQAEVGARVIDALIECDAVDARTLIMATVLEVEADLDLEAQKQRYAQARANRGVWVKQVEDGMARIGAEVDAVSAQRFQLDLDVLCRVQKRADDRAGVERTAEQRRADVLAELPGRHAALLRAFQKGTTAAELVGADQSDVMAGLCALPVPNPSRLYVHIPMTTLLDLDNRSGWVEGLGPVSAHQSRLLLPTASLQALWVDADTGLPLGLDDKVVDAPSLEPDWADEAQMTLAAEEARERLRSLTRPAAVVVDEVEPGRFASEGLARFVRVRDLLCVGPGCPLPASRCELDHLEAVSEGGVTAAWSLGLKSSRCHHARHEGWIAERNDDGSTMWTSPAGGVYVRRSPWRSPPPIRGPLPPPKLDRPDGGKVRTFGVDPDAGAVPCPEVSQPGPPPPADEPPSHPVRTRRTALDVLRERPRVEPDPVPDWGRPWHTDDPPPF